MSGKLMCQNCERYFNLTPSINLINHVGLLQQHSYFTYNLHPKRISENDERRVPTEIVVRALEEVETPETGVPETMTPQRKEA